MANVTVTTDAHGGAHVALVAGERPEVRDAVDLGALEAAGSVPALDSIVLEFDHYGRVVGLRVTGAAESVLSPSLLEAADPGRPPACS